MTDIDWQLVRISIHALRKESDTGNEPMIIANKFQSTLSVRRATSAGRAHLDQRHDFNPRSP